MLNKIKQKMKNLLLRGSEANDQINILGDDGVPLDYHVNFWRSELIDFVILLRNARNCECRIPI